MSLFHKLLYLGIKYHSSGKVYRANLIKHFMKLYYQCDIPMSTNIHNTVYFCHGGFGTVINPKTIIKENTIIQHKVTLGEIVRGVELL